MYSIYSYDKEVTPKDFMTYTIRYLEKSVV